MHLQCYIISQHYLQCVYIFVFTKTDIASAIQNKGSIVHEFRTAMTNTGKASVCCVRQMEYISLRYISEYTIQHKSVSKARAR